MAATARSKVRARQVEFFKIETRQCYANRIFSYIFIFLLGAVLL